jgi:hypothetical protein
MATDQPQLDQQLVDADDPPRATVTESQRYPQDDDHSITDGLVYEGRITTVHGGGNALVALDKPWHDTDVNGILPTDRQLANLYQPGDEVYVTVADRSNMHGGVVFQEVCIVGTEDRSDIATADTHSADTDETQSDSATSLPENLDDWAERDTSSDETEVDAEAEAASDATDGEAESDGGDQEYACPYCPSGGVTAATPEAIRRHITNTDDGAHKDRHGSDAEVYVLAIDGDDGDETVYGIASEGGDVARDDTGSVSASLVPERNCEAERDRAIAELALKNPTEALSGLAEKVYAEHGERVHWKHVRSVVADMPRRASLNLDPHAWNDREVLAKLFYYYGMSQDEIASRYNIGATQMSKLMSSFDINPGQGHLGGYDERLPEIHDQFGYEWATEGANAGADDDPNDDPDIPLPDDETDTDAESDADADADADGDGDDTAAATEPAGESETTTTSTGNATYTGPAKGLDMTTQTWDERPVKTAKRTGSDWTDIEIHPAVTQLEPSDLPNDNDSTLSRGRHTSPENYRRLLTLIMDSEGAVPADDLLDMPAVTYSRTWVLDQLRGLYRKGILERHRDDGRSPYKYDIATDGPIPDLEPEPEPQSDAPTADAHDAESDRTTGDGLSDDEIATLARQRLGGKWSAPPQSEAESEQTADDDATTVTITEDQIESVRAVANGVFVDAPDGSEMEMYAKGMNRTLEMLPVDNE